MPATQASQVDSAGDTQSASQAFARLRFAIKTALSLTLAYLIPIAMGWPQPQTAAITVMLIAATGNLSDSLQKGVMRVLGTAAGAIIGLSLIALFPQERMTYLLVVSLVVSVIIYLYNAYQRDSTLFMLTAVVTLMVFNGGDAEGAFLYGVDRAFMTIFGVLVYTVVASLLWPVKTEDNTHWLAAAACANYRDAFTRLVRGPAKDHPPLDRQLGDLLASMSAFQTQFASARGGSDAIAAYQAEWYTLAACYQDLENILLPALKQSTRQDVDFSRYVQDYEGLLDHIETMFNQVQQCWNGEQADNAMVSQPVEQLPGSLQGERHLTVAHVATRMELLEEVQAVLLQINAVLDSLLLDRGSFGATRLPRSKPAFLWLDLENFKTALRVFTTFWIACAIWIQFNPPGGFQFVVLSTVLIPLVSYTPVTPRLLFILFTLGFAFALPAYVFLLPALTHWVELALFLFAYAFLGFYVLKGPVSIFFLMGLFTLGIQNTMSYHFNGIVLIMLMFYVICALLIISIHFPFTSKPERIYTSLRRRFFLHCARLAVAAAGPAGGTTWWTRLRLQGGMALLAKLHHWGGMIDRDLFPVVGQDKFKAFNDNCDLLQGQILVLYRRAEEFRKNPLIADIDAGAQASLLGRLCRELAENRGQAAFDETRSALSTIEQRLDEHLGSDYQDRYGRHELAQFYVYLSLQASIISSLYACLEAQNQVDWHLLADARF